MRIVEMTEFMCVAEPGRKVYVNSTAGRNALAADKDDIENYEDVMSVWGEEPTVVFPPSGPTEPDPAPAGNLETRVAAVESDVADLTAAVEKGLRF